MGSYTFGEAIKALKEGKRVRRIGWRDPRKFLWLSKTAGVDCSLLGDQADTPVHACICLYCPREDGPATVLPGWTPLQCDMLTDDWNVLEGPLRG